MRFYPRNLAYRTQIGAKAFPRKFRATDDRNAAAAEGGWARARDLAYSAAAAGAPRLDDTTTADHSGADRKP
jgi:hypothetical protein